MRELTQMERQSRRRDAELIGDGTGGKTIGSGLDQRAENGQPRFLGEGAESCNRCR